MKILLVTIWSFPHLNGVNSYIQSLRDILEHHGHEVDILAHNPNLINNIYLISNNPKLNGKTVDKAQIINFLSPLMVDYFKENLPHVDPWVHWQEIERYTFELAASLFDLNHYSLIHTQDIISTRAISRVKPVHVPLVTTIHGLLSKEMLITENSLSENSGFSLKWWNYLTLKENIGVLSADQIIIPSKWLAKLFSEEEIGVPFDKINIIPYGMETSSFIQSMKEDPSPPIIEHTKTFVISCPARLVALKGHQTLIDSLNIVKESRNDFICWFIGDGDLEENLKKYSKEKGLSNHIVFLGERTDIPSLLNRSDMVVLPSLQDNLPFAIIEAQVAGKPIVASNVGGIPEMISHRETGLLFEKGNSAQLAESILELMSNSDLRLQLSSNVKTWSELHWSIEREYENTMKIYERAFELVNSPNRTPITEVNLDGQYGLIDTEIPQDAVDNIFKFEVNIVLFTRIWEEISESLPSTYYIPDTVIIQKLCEK